MELDGPPTEDEVRKANNELLCVKSADPNESRPEVFKAGGLTLIQKFSEFLCTCWEDGCLPPNLNHTRIVHMSKGKGGMQLQQIWWDLPYEYCRQDPL